VTHVSEPVAADERLYATMRRLMAGYARQQASEIPGPRGVVQAGAHGKEGITAA